MPLTFDNWHLNRSVMGNQGSLSCAAGCPRGLQKPGMDVTAELYKAGLLFLALWVSLIVYLLVRDAIERWWWLSNMTTEGLQGITVSLIFVFVSLFCNAWIWLFLYKAVIFKWINLKIILYGRTGRVLWFRLTTASHCYSMCIIEV